MQEQIEKRLRELRAEFEAGQEMLVELESRQTELKETLLRITGAIQVLEELSGLKSGIQCQREACEKAGQQPVKLEEKGVDEVRIC